MSKEDIKKGIAIQAKADAEKIEKLAKGLNAHREVLVSLESGQGEIRDAMGVVLDDMSAGEAKYLYDLQVKKTPDELDETEKRVLCATIFTLLSSYGQNNPDQTAFYTNLEKYLCVAERKSDFDFFTLNNVDSHTDRLVMLKAICSFLFLKEKSFSFLREKETFSWLFAFAPVKDISDICSAINAEYAVLGEKGILGNYDPLLAPHKVMDDQFYALTSGEKEPQQLEADLDNETDYKDLTGIIVTAVSDESSFGKGVAFSEKDLKNELSRKFDDVAFDSLIAISKVEKGYLVFTTHAVYVKSKGLFNSGYICLPYKDILADKMSTVDGKQPGARKLLIPVMTGEKVITVSIDDSKLQEEKLRDLLIAIIDSGCTIADTDRVIKLWDLDDEAKKKLLSVAVYLFKAEELPLVDVLLLSGDWKVNDEWNSICSRCNSDEDLSRLVADYIQQIPYPSKRVTAIESIELLLSLVTRANSTAGKLATSLSLKMEKAITSFATEAIGEKQFGLMVKEADGKIKDRSYDEYVMLRDELSEKEFSCSDLLIPYTEAIIKRIEASLDFKAKAAMKKATKEVVKFASEVQEKAKDNINEILKDKKK